MNKLVLGLGFGDEGKGLTTDYLCSKSSNPLVIRFNGGHQAGHTVVRNGIRHVFANFGSGTLLGVPTYWSSKCTVEPVGLLKELKILQEKGIDPKLYIDMDCPVTTPYDISFNQNLGRYKLNGTVGVGFGATLKREEARYSLKFVDLFYPPILETRLKLIEKYYEFGTLDISSFIQACEDLIKSPNVDLVKDQDLIYKYRTRIFEGAQGLLLDQDTGFFPNVTRSNTGTKNVLELFDVEDNLEVFLVTRAYQTRHGNGFMTNLDIPHEIELNPKETNVENEWQGNFKRTLLDVSLLEYAIQRDEFLRYKQNKNLVITCLDHVQKDYRFTYNRSIFECSDENDFLTQISSILETQGIGKIYLSHSEEGKQIKEWKS